MKRAKGFTLVELVIVIVIVGILSIVAVPIYRGYTRKAMASEGKALLGTIQTAQKVYFAEYAAFKGVTTTSCNTELDVDARANKYFTSFTVSAASATGDGANYTATTTGNGGASGITLSLFASAKSVPTFEDSGLNN
ncbi:MAG: prepilin-type N-terminal cleavage/methylation domain-containing protein [Endomicrobiaceae bacterium]|nr:prepilin-type N-terminal cleavage/methylation domain-containing protein [Endomicrobiaceae bacterium]